MGRIEGRMLRPLLWLALLTVALLSPGCQTGPETTLFTVSGPGWRVQEGQALWRPRRNPQNRDSWRGVREVWGDVWCNYHAYHHTSRRL